MVLDVDFSERDGVTYIDGVAVRLRPEDRAVIEAALDLLAACKTAADALNPAESWDAELSHGAYRKCRAAIAKATPDPQPAGTDRT